MTASCTITISATEVCGMPPVTTFKNSRGKLFHECVGHSPYGKHVLTCELPLPLCGVCSGQFQLSPTQTVLVGP